MLYFSYLSTPFEERNDSCKEGVLGCIVSFILANGVLLRSYEGMYCY